MILDFSSLNPRDISNWLVSTINPRPIAWVSTISANGVTNLAPFSYFQIVSPHPPTLLFIPVNDREGGKKDTLRNILEVPEFVVHVVNTAMAEKMNRTAERFAYGESEFEKCGIPSVKSDKVRPPRVAGAPVAYECKLDRIVVVGEGALAGNVVFGTIQLVHVDESVLTDGRIDPVKLDTIGRMGGDVYARTTDCFTIKRPV